jgi:hypothetical protein
MISPYMWRVKGTLALLAQSVAGHSRDVAVPAHPIPTGLQALALGLCPA